VHTLGRSLDHIEIRTQCSIRSVRGAGRSRPHADIGRICSASRVICPLRASLLFSATFSPEIASRVSYLQTRSRLKWPAQRDGVHG
jgi:hypothetical protein